MPALDVKPFTRRDNSSILNAIRKDSTTTYQERVPEATQADFQTSMRIMLDNTPLRNEFIDALVNRIGLVIARNTSWTNPLAKFKRGMLAFGDTIEEVQIGLLEAKVYDPDREYLERDIFGKEIINAQSNFHKVNRENYYKITVNEGLLARAFLDPMGLSTFIDQLLEAPMTSDQWDEFLLTTALFKQYYDNGGFFKVNVPDVAAQGSDAADAKFALRRIREFIGNLQFISTQYNASGMPIAAKPDELELFVTPEFNAALDVEALAAAFNVDYADVETRTTVIPQEYFGIEGAQAILTTRDFFVIADQRLETTTAVNPVGLHTNYFLHHWQVISASRFVPAILFTTEAGDVINQIETPVVDVTALVVTDSTGATVTDVERGQSFRVSGSAVTNPAGGVNDAIRLTLVGAQSPRTYLSQTGVLSVALDEDAIGLRIVATATDNESITEILDVDVIGEKVELWPNPRVMEDADNDGLLEVTPSAVPAAPTSGAQKNKVKIPDAEEGFDYKDGATVVSGQTITLTANKTITAVAKAGYEIKSGATASWNLVFTA